MMVNYPGHAPTTHPSFRRRLLRVDSFARLSVFTLRDEIVQRFPPALDEPVLTRDHATARQNDASLSYIVLNES